MTTLNDDFARADAETIGNGWTEYTVGFKIRSGAIEPDSTATAAARMGATATGDQYAEMIVGSAYDGSFVGPCARMPALGTSHTTTGAYYALWLSGSTGTAFSLRRKDSNATTNVVLGGGNTASDVRAPGLTMRIRVYDDPDTAGRVRLEGYVNGARVVTAYDDSGLVPNTQRGVGVCVAGATTLRIGAFNAADQAAPAPTGGGGDTTAPPVPTGLALSTPGYATIAATWTGVSATDLAGYRLYRSTGATVTTADTLIGNPTGTSFTDTTVTGGITYRYAVSSVDTAGNESALSTSVTKTATTAPAPPSGATPVGFALWNGTALVPVSVPMRGGATGSRPSASTAGAGASWYDTTLGKPTWSDGTVWRDAAGTTV